MSHPDGSIEQRWEHYAAEEHAVWRTLFERQTLPLALAQIGFGPLYARIKALPELSPGASGEGDRIVA